MNCRGTSHPDLTSQGRTYVLIVVASFHANLRHHQTLSWHIYTRRPDLPMPAVRISRSQSQIICGDSFPRKSPVIEDYESDMEHKPQHICAAEREGTQKGKRKQSLDDTRLSQEKSKRNVSPLKQVKILTDQMVFTRRCRPLRRSWRALPYTRSSGVMRYEPRPASIITYENRWTNSEGLIMRAGQVPDP